MGTDVRRCNLNFGAGGIWGRGRCSECVWCSGVKERPPALHLECLSLSHFPVLQEECQNYVRVLIVAGRKVFLCGTNAFSPVCSSRQVGAARWGADRRGPKRFSHPSTALEWSCQIQQKTKPNKTQRQKQKRIPNLIEFQVNNKWYFSKSMSCARFGTYLY